MNNYTQQDLETLSSLPPSMSYLLYAEEIAPTTNTPHLQGYLEIHKKKTLNGLKNILTGLKLSPCHLLIALGDVNAQKVYISKENPPTELGSPMVSGSRKDLRLVADLAESRTPLRSIARSFPEVFIRHHRGIERLCGIFNDEARDFKSNVKIYIGPTGTGKSRKAHEEDKITWTHAGDRWFDAYEGQECVLFDDFEGIKSGVPFRKLLQLTDRYPLRVPTKGGFVNWRPKTIIFTTNVEPDQWYPDEDYSPLKRRIDSITRFAALEENH